MDNKHIPIRLVYNIIYEIILNGIMYIEPTT